MAGFETSGEPVVKVGNGMSFSIASNPNTTGNSSAKCLLQYLSAGQLYEAVKSLFPSVAVNMTQDGKKLISFDFYQTILTPLLILI